MVLRGHLHKEGQYWVIHVPDLEITTQGHTKRDAYKMIKEAIELHVDRKVFSITVDPISKDEFVVSANDTARMIGLMLKRQRQINGLSVGEVTKRLKKKTNTYYHQYETGKAAAGLDKISEFIEAMNPGLCVELNLVQKTG
jgi:predicted RNase H-like HicB family nuclease